MSNVCRIHVLPAQRGDALWIEYGTEDAPNHILIDGGITATGRDHLRKRVEEVGTPLHFELLVVTHIDLDHIQGILQFLEDLPDGITFGDIWFNGWEQMKAIGLEPMGVKEGTRLSEILKEKHKATWNKAAGGKAIALEADGSVVTYSIDGGMKLTVLGPAHEQLVKLRERWDEVIEEFGTAEEAAGNGEQPPGLDFGMPGLEPMGPIDVQELAESKFKEDVTIPNGSSIALVLEYEGRIALMLGDAYPSVIATSLRTLSPSGRFKADVVKLAHHGSRNNTDRAMTSLLSAPTWIFSSNGAGNTKHPHKESVARVLHDGKDVKTLIFNYRTSFNDVWDDKDLMEEFEYEVVYGDGHSPVVVILK
jgi:beta-lactamase superfamily II metal-dependent hydrolase